MKKISENRFETVKRAGLLLLVLLVVAGLFLPTGYYIEKPGSAESLTNIVQVNGKKDTQAGKFMLTTVGIQPGTAFTLLRAKFRDFEEIVSKESLMGDNTDQEYEKIQQINMETSQNTAIKVAMDLAKIPHTFKLKGIYVGSISKESDFYKELAIGDMILKVDGKTFDAGEDFLTYVKKQKVGQKISVTYVRDGKEKTVTGKLIKLADKKAGIGIYPVDYSVLSSDTKVTIDAGSIGGPSAGLMFTLETYAVLSGKNLRKGRIIAGTGTISASHKVGAIGGIDKKIVAASKEGAEIFFAPVDGGNYKEAVKAGKKIKTKMKIVPVKTVQDALDYLETLK